MFTKFVIDLQKFAIGDAVPSITFFIDIPVDEVLKRKGNVEKADLDRIEVSKLDFYENVRNGYKYLSENEERFVRIDGLMSIEEIHEEIVSLIKNH